MNSTDPFVKMEFILYYYDTYAAYNMDVDEGTWYRENYDTYTISNYALDNDILLLEGGLEMVDDTFISILETYDIDTDIIVGSLDEMIDIFDGAS